MGTHRREAFRRIGGNLLADGVRLDEIAGRFGTPLYVYSARGIVDGYRKLRVAAGRRARIAYSVKASSNRAILALLARLGAHFDIVSGGELDRVLRAGIEPSRVVFAGVGKSAAELRAALRLGVGEIILESAGEAARVLQLAAKLEVRPRLSIRLNPDVAAPTHPHIATGHAGSKFGVDAAAGLAIARMIHGSGAGVLTGVHLHIGSQIRDPRAYAKAARAGESFVRRLGELSATLESVDFGGGFGIAYAPGDAPPDLRALVAPLRDSARRMGLVLTLEPGRSIVGPAGVLLTRVEYVKQSTASTIVVVDAAMTELPRPSLYGAWHTIEPVLARRDAPQAILDVVGPVCESGDFLARGRKMPVPRAGDLLAIMDCGAYAASMASLYNSRPLAAEVMVEDGSARLVRRRMSLADLSRHELS